MEVEITLGASSISSGWRSRSKPRHLEARHDSSDLERERRGLLPVSRDIPHEDVCPDQSDFHQSPFSSSLSEDLGTLQPTSCLHSSSSLLASTSSPWLGKTKYPISDDYLGLLSEKVGLLEKNCSKVSGLEERPGAKSSKIRVMGSLAALLEPRSPLNRPTKGKKLDNM